MEPAAARSDACMMNNELIYNPSKVYFRGPEGSDNLNGSDNDFYQSWCAVYVLIFVIFFLNAIYVLWTCVTRVTIDVARYT
jgi:hypothetical protein